MGNHLADPAAHWGSQKHGVDLLAHTNLAQLRIRRYTTFCCEVLLLLLIMAVIVDESDFDAQRRQLHAASLGLSEWVTRRGWCLVSA